MLFSANVNLVLLLCRDKKAALGGCWGASMATYPPVSEFKEL